MAVFAELVFLCKDEIILSFVAVNPFLKKDTAKETVSVENRELL